MKWLPIMLTAVAVALAAVAASIAVPPGRWRLSSKYRAVVIPVRRLNHAVLYVRDVPRAVAFYERAFGFRVIDQDPQGRAAFLRSSFGDNHHDLGLFQVGADAPGPVPGGVGLYHLAWEVDEIADLVTARDLLLELGALVGASDHGASKSLYGKDPDGNEFEVMWAVPREVWEQMDHATTAHLDLEAEAARWNEQ
jgi:catechol-2,3-dioxygenase